MLTLHTDGTTIGSFCAQSTSNNRTARQLEVRGEEVGYNRSKSVPPGGNSSSSDAHNNQITIDFNTKQICTPGSPSGLTKPQRARLYVPEINDKISKVQFPNIFVKLGDPLGITSDVYSSRDIQHDYRPYMLKQRRCDYFTTMNHFMALLIQISNLLVNEPDKSNR